MPDRIRVLIVDDSRLFRSALEEALRGQEDIAVVGSVFSGAKAIEFIRQTPPDVVTLDVEMPGMNGLEALQQIQQLNPSIGVVMVSAFTRSGADITVKALQAGAFDFVAKPSGPAPEENQVALRDEVLAKIRAYARHRIRPVPRTSISPVTTAPAIARRSSPTRVIAIGASTGGPRALAALLPELCSLVSVPILIVQHMPPGFTQSLADSLARETKKTVLEAAEGVSINADTVYVAPGGRHLVIRGSAGAARVGLTDQPPENGCRPSADVLFRSAASVFGSAVTAIILTGMGRDGAAGLGAIKRAGGYVFAQDEASSVVWGMPGSAVEAGVTDEVLPLNQLARAVAARVHGSRRG